MDIRTGATDQLVATVTTEKRDLFKLPLTPLDDVKFLRQVNAIAYSLSGPPRSPGIDSASRNDRAPLIGRQREHDAVRQALDRPDRGCRAICRKA